MSLISVPSQHVGDYKLRFQAFWERRREARDFDARKCRIDAKLFKNSLDEVSIAAEIAALESHFRLVLSIETMRWEF